MKLETKYNIGDTIFFFPPMTPTKPRVLDSIIRGIKIDVNFKGDYEITYLCNEKEDQRVHVKVEEEGAFKSKEDLIKSL